MRERPILFSAPMVRALLAGRKMQTRRIARPASKLRKTSQGIEAGEGGNPFGQAGHRLWVKESWCTPAEWDHLKPSQLSQEQIRSVSYHADSTRKGKTRSSLFMPRSASRILLEIVQVRKERLQDISEADALAEGVAAPDAIGNYAKLWDSINGKGSWDANPWVWVISFKRLTGAGRDAVTG